MSKVSITENKTEDTYNRIYVEHDFFFVEIIPVH